MPFLADAYGMYYNKDMFAKAGITAPPKTIDELTDDAKKLTTRTPTASLKMVGFDPLVGFYENAPERWTRPFGAQVAWTRTASRRSARDPDWPKLLTGRRA